MANKQLTRILNGIETDVLLQYFADRVLVIVTQLGKVGCFIQATIPSTAPLPTVQKRKSTSEPLILPNPPPAIELSRLFGTTPSVWTNDREDAIGERRNVIVGMALRRKAPQERTPAEDNRELYMEVMGMVLELLEIQ